MCVCVEVRGVGVGGGGSGGVAGVQEKGSRCDVLLDESVYICHV